MVTRDSKNQGAKPATVEEFLDLPYRIEITRGSYGDFVVRYPELPGCMTQVSSLEEVPAAAAEILADWIAAALEDEFEIPVPVAQEEFSGKFVVRISKSLHRDLVMTARAEGVSLNQYSSQLLAAGQAIFRVERKIDLVCEKVDRMHADIRQPDFLGLPGSEQFDPLLEHELAYAA